MNMIFPLGNIYALPAMVSLDVRFSNDENNKARDTLETLAAQYTQRIAK